MAAKISTECAIFLGCNEIASVFFPFRHQETAFTFLNPIFNFY